MKIFLESTVKQFSCGGEKTKVFKSWLQQKFLDVLVKMFIFSSLSGKGATL